jgi:gentisate 1,2-dioxygenase
VLAFVMFWVEPVFPHEQASAQTEASLPIGNIENCRPGAMSIERIRQTGTIPARFEGIGVPMVIILFPGYGTRNAGLHTGILPKGSNAHAHTHPISDDCVIYLQGKGSAEINGEAVSLNPLDAVAAPVLVPHGAGEPAPERALLSGYGAPPQQELYERQGYLKAGSMNGRSSSGWRT